MSRRSRNILFWGSVILVVSGIVYLAYRLWNNGATTEDFIGFIFGAIIPSLGFLYTLLINHSIRFYIWIAKFRSLFSYSAPTWNLSVTYLGEHVQQSTLELIIKKLRETNENSASIKVRRIDPDAKDVNIEGGPNLQLRYNRPIPASNDVYDKEPSSIQLFINNYKVGYRETANSLKRDILPALELVGKISQASETKYTFTITFAKHENPFFGMYLAHLPPHIISNFVVRLVINDFGSKDTIQISENRVAINTQSQNALHHLALEFLTFGSRLRERLENA